MGSFLCAKHVVNVHTRHRNKVYELVREHKPPRNTPDGSAFVFDIFCLLTSRSSGEVGVGAWPYQGFAMEFGSTNVWGVRPLSWTHQTSRPTLNRFSRRQTKPQCEHLVVNFTLKFIQATNRSHIARKKYTSYNNSSGCQPSMMHRI